MWRKSCNSPTLNCKSYIDVLLFFCSTLKRIYVWLFRKRLRKELQQISVEEDLSSKQAQSYTNHINSSNIRLVTLEADLRQIQAVERRLVTAREKLVELKAQLSVSFRRLICLLVLFTDKLILWYGVGH